MIQFLKQYTHELLDVVLDEGVTTGPSKRLGDVVCGTWFAFTELEHPKQLLELHGDGSLGFAMQGWIEDPLVEDRADLGGHVKGLEEGIEITGGSLIVESNETGFGFAIEI